MWSSYSPDCETSPCFNILNQERSDWSDVCRSGERQQSDGITTDTPALSLPCLNNSPRCLLIDWSLTRWSMSNLTSCLRLDTGGPR